MAKILIIDDNAIMRKNIWFMLRREKHTILEAPDGPTGIAIARADKPDLVLLDFMLPYMSGEQVAKYFHDHEDLHDIPLIILTAMNQPDLVMNMLKLNVRAYLLKPVSADTLRERIGTVLGQAAPAPPPAPDANPPATLAEETEEPSPERVITEAQIDIADWIIFAMLDVKAEAHPQSNAVRELLRNRYDILRNKNLVLFALDAPYFLDETEISQLTAYYVFYSRGRDYLRAAARTYVQAKTDPATFAPVQVYTQKPVSMQTTFI